jgi:hypothetical protein
VPLLLTVLTDTLRGVVLFRHGSLAFGRRGLIIMRIIFLGQMRVREILLIIMLHVVDRITT